MKLKKRGNAKAKKPRSCRCRSSQTEERRRSAEEAFAARWEEKRAEIAQAHYEWQEAFYRASIWQTPEKNAEAFARWCDYREALERLTPYRA